MGLFRINNDCYSYDIYVVADSFSSALEKANNKFCPNWDDKKITSIEQITKDGGSMIIV